jgi:glycosyltransferase involved in cell wall biosynthesis
MSVRKKILFTTENSSFGGSELLWTKTVIEMTKLHFDIAICVNKKLELPKELFTLEQERKIKIELFFESNLSFWKRVVNRFVSYKFRIKPVDLRQDYIFKFNPDLIVMNQGFNFNAVQLMSFANKSNLNYVTISHAVNERLWPTTAMRAKLKLGFNNSKKNYFVSQDNLSVTQNQLGYFLNNAEVVRNPFNVNYINDIQLIQDNGFHLACVGRYDFYAKGQDVLLQTISSEKWKGRNLNINFYGEGGDLENLMDLVDMYQLKNVSINGHTLTSEIWKKNHGLVLTSRFEGLPVVIVEAMLCKRFVVVTNVSGSKELVIDNENGFIISAPRIEYIDEALERAWVKRDDWKAIGENARRTIVEEIPENPAFEFAIKLNEILNSL